MKFDEIDARHGHDVAARPDEAPEHGQGHEGRRLERDDEARVLREGDGRVGHDEVEHEALAPDGAAHDELVEHAVARVVFFDGDEVGPEADDGAQSADVAHGRREGHGGDAREHFLLYQAIKRGLDLTTNGLP